MNKYLVIGINTHDDIFTISRPMESAVEPSETRRNGEVFSRFLADETLRDGEGFHFEKILVVHDNEVIADMNQGEHYDVEGD